jgi:hypothetical protein
LIRYQLYISGAAKSQAFTLLGWEIDEPRPKVVLEGVTLDNTGRAICAGLPNTCGSQAKPDDPIELVVLAAKGEPKRFALISEDGKHKAFASIVPFPITAHDHGCSLSAILGMRDAELVLLRATGFNPAVQIEIQYSSEGEHKTIIAKTTEEGSHDQVILPFVRGKVEGTATISVNAAMCRPALSFEWGTGTYHLQ